MKINLNVTLLQHLLFMLLPFFSLQAFSQSPSQSSIVQDHVFSYSIIDLGKETTDLTKTIKDESLAELVQQGAVVYATWLYADKPGDAPFNGLKKNQIGLMLAWPSDLANPLEAVTQTLNSLDNLSIISNRLFQAMYLPAGLNVPTATGFYVHREEHYKSEDVSDAVRLSKEAWQTWEPFWKVKVIGLFRELSPEAEFENLNRIVWYPSYEAWLDTRNFTSEMQSASRFRERRLLLIPGSGVAIATDRLSP